jgi:hypothetical protein
MRQVPRAPARWEREPTEPGRAQANRRDNADLRAPAPDCNRDSAWFERAARVVAQGVRILAALGPIERIAVMDQVERLVAGDP